jgi:hypothetical protein
MTSYALAAVLTAVLASAAAPPPAPTVVAVDSETVVDGVPVGCTGIGQTKNDPKWLAYPVRIEFSNAAGEYLRGGEVTIYDGKSRAVLAVSCDSPWTLLKLPKGTYRVEGHPLDSPAKPRSAPFTPPAKGQIRVVLPFPDA